MQVQPAGGALSGSILFRSDLFDRRTIESLAGHYRLLLEAAIVRPDVPIGEHSILPPEEREEIVDRRNATSVDFPRDATVHELFEEQVAMRPQATALVYRGRSLSYSELDEMACRLASRLRSLGVGPEDRVGLLLPRSPQLIAAILAVLKAGGAYVPLDITQPQARTRFILADVGAKALIAARDHAASFADCGAVIVPIETGDDAIHLPREEQVEAAPSGSATGLAYVIYTSGSTGEPKGVLIEHRSIVRLVLGAAYATFGPDRVFLQLAPPAFDASTFEIWGALLHGVRLVIAPEGPLDLEALETLIAFHRVTTLWLTAGLFNEIVEARPSASRGVAEILTGGEALSPRHTP